MENNNVNYSILKKHSSKENSAVGHFNYDQQHVLKFFVDHPAISASYIERSCNLPNGTIRHFLKERRNIPLVHFKTVEDELMKYGYKPLNSE
jgi:predicted transcriptional regulator